MPTSALPHRPLMDAKPEDAQNGSRPISDQVGGRAITIGRVPRTVHEQLLDLQDLFVHHCDGFIEPRA